jgi:hypothetical protein
MLLEQSDVSFLWPELPFVNDCTASEPEDYIYNGTR